MKKRKLKGYVLPVIYSVLILSVFISIGYMSNFLATSPSYDGVSIDVLDVKKTVPVISETNNIESKIEKPFLSDKVEVSKAYYDMKDKKEDQEKALIYYEKTYLQNSGILYTSGEEFDVLSTYDGEVTKIGKDNILGDYIEITHNPNLKTIYYSLKDISIHEGDIVTSGMQIAKSGANNLDKNDNCLLFEVFYNGFTMNPNDYYESDIENLK